MAITSNSKKGSNSNSRAVFKRPRRRRQRRATRFNRPLSLGFGAGSFSSIGNTRIDATGGATLFGSFGSQQRRRFSVSRSIRPRRRFSSMSASRSLGVMSSLLPTTYHNRTLSGKLDFAANADKCLTCLYVSSTRVMISEIRLRASLFALSAPQRLSELLKLRQRIGKTNNIELEKRLSMLEQQEQDDQEQQQQDQQFSNNNMFDDSQESMVNVAERPNKRKNRNPSPPLNDPEESFVRSTKMPSLMSRIDTSHSSSLNIGIVVVRADVNLNLVVNNFRAPIDQLETQYQFEISENISQFNSSKLMYTPNSDLLLSSSAAIIYSRSGQFKSHEMRKSMADKEIMLEPNDKLYLIMSRDITGFSVRNLYDIEMSMTDAV